MTIEPLPALPLAPPPPFSPIFPPPLATLDQLGARMAQDFTTGNGDPTDPDGMRAGAALNDASALIRATAGEDWLDDADPPALTQVPFVIQTITLSVAQRAYNNPNGAIQASVGDASVTWARGESGAGSVFLTSSEIKLIRKAVGLSAVGSVQFVTEYVPPSGRTGNGDPLYAPDPDGGDPIPLGPVPWEL
jgi:hypothetical protein